MTHPDLTPADFAAFFEAVHQVPPFPWQDRLLREIADSGGWPAVLDLPTGSGKTAALDIAVFHLALDAARGLHRQAPIRIAFVVDRRLIVDDAFARAEKLQKALTNPRAAIVEQVAAALRSFAGTDAPPLLARRLRGGMPLEEDWARTPNQPTILCSTVDQVGSRLLFRGYGISDRMKPVHAGLLGSDCLILLDEAHLAEPFRQTVRAIHRLRTGDDAPWGVALLSATSGGEEPVQFRLDQADFDHPVLSRRLLASKLAALGEIPARQNVPVEDRRVADIAERAKAALVELQQTIANPALGVIVNRVARARAVFERLRADLAEQATVTLVIGPARADPDREQRLALVLNPIRTGAGRDLGRPLVIVATQTIEAGVDIDLDGLVTEAASLDALRQRFGRLNRAGRPITAVAAILAHREDFGAKANDAVYGDRLATTWKALQEVAADNIVEFGIAGFPKALIGRAGELIAPKVNAPVVMPAYADLWSHTSPIPNADPEVSLFLHGPGREPASVQIVWRADLSEDDLEDSDLMREILSLVPPRAAEAIELPLWTVRAWLHGEAGSLTDLSDAPERTPEDSTRTRNRRVFRYAEGDNAQSEAIDARDLRPGDVIVVPADYGGCDEWGWHPAATRPVFDLAESAGWPYRGRRYAVRVTPELIHQFWQQQAASDQPAPDLQDIGARLRAALADAEEAKPKDLLEAVCALDLPPQLRSFLEPLRAGEYKRGRLTAHLPYRNRAGDASGVILVAPSGLKIAAERGELAAAPATESDEIGLFNGYPLLLSQHSRDVREAAAEFARRVGLGDALVADVALAGYLHDLGKKDQRFQAFLAGGDLLGWDDSLVLAKSGHDRLPRGAWDRAGLPENWRHEALSVRLARNCPELATAHDPALVLWLVGVHHGYGRPFFPHADPEEPAEKPGPQSLAFDFEGCDWAGLFDRLKRTYGIWGLARLEALVRLADHRASETAERRYAGN